MGHMIMAHFKLLSVGFLQSIIGVNFLFIYEIVREMSDESITVKSEGHTVKSFSDSPYMIELMLSS